MRNLHANGAILYDETLRMRSADGTPSMAYARALQEPARDAWRGNNANIAAAQAALSHRAKCNSGAARGRLAHGGLRSLRYRDEE